MGPFSATLSAHGTRADLAARIAVDLDHVGVRAFGLQKPMGARFGLDLEGRVATVVDLTRGSLRLGPLALLGAPEATVSLVTTGDKVSAKITADLGATTLGVAPVFTKAAGRPARLSFAIDRDGDHTSLLDAHVALPGATIDGLSIDLAPHRAHVVVASAAVALAPLTEMMPLLGAVIPPKLAAATARFSLDFSGDPDDPASAKVHVGALEIQSGLGRVVGSVDVDGLRLPRAISIRRWRSTARSRSRRGRSPPRPTARSSRSDRSRSSCGSWERRAGFRSRSWRSPRACAR